MDYRYSNSMTLNLGLRVLKEYVCEQASGSFNHVKIL